MVCKADDGAFSSSQLTTYDLLFTRLSIVHFTSLTGDTMKPTRWLSLIAVLLLSFVASFAQPGQMTQQQRELADYIKKNYTKREVMIPMRDGVKLFACIYEPKDKKQKYPIMFDRTPYRVS